MSRTQDRYFARAAPRPLLAWAAWFFEKLPKDAFARAVAQEADQADFLPVQFLDGVAQAFAAISIVAARKRVVNVRRPVFFLECRQNCYLVFGHLPEALGDDTAKPQFTAILIPDRLGFGPPGISVAVGDKVAMQLD